MPTAPLPHRGTSHRPPEVDVGGHVDGVALGAALA
jgi:hypothetical protein